MAARLPGVVCRFLDALDVDAGTLCRNASPTPGPTDGLRVKRRKGHGTSGSWANGKPQTAEPPDFGTPKTARAKAYRIDDAVAHLDANAHATSQGHCAKYVREAIEAGGVSIPLPRPLYAKDYGPALTQLGFSRVDSTGYEPRKGDIVVLQPPQGQSAGHLEMYNGTVWVSDFTQSEDIYPGPAYRKEQVAYEIFRP